MRIYMQTPAARDKPPRYYQLYLQKDLLGGWSVVKEWGFQGASGRVMKEHYEEYELAMAALLHSRDQQVERGYQIMFVHGMEPPPQY